MRVHRKTQSQESLTDQLRKLVVLADQEGLYDAADLLRAFLRKDVKSRVGRER